MFDTLIQAFWVALGAAIGGPARAFISGLIGSGQNDGFPFGTLVVNVSGAFIIGVAAAIASADRVPTTANGWLFAVTGVLGSYTTVSTFSLQTLALTRPDSRRRRPKGRPALYVVTSVALSIAATAFGFAFGSVLGRLS